MVSGEFIIFYLVDDVISFCVGWKVHFNILTPPKSRSHRTRRSVVIFFTVNSHSFVHYSDKHRSHIPQGLRNRVYMHIWILQCSFLQFVWFYLVLCVTPFNCPAHERIMVITVKLIIAGAWQIPSSSRSIHYTFWSITV